MAHVIFRHTVESYAKWRPLFNEQASLREAAGAIGDPMVFRSGDNPFEVLVLMEWEELGDGPQVGDLRHSQGGDGGVRRQRRADRHISHASLSKTLRRPD